MGSFKKNKHKESRTGISGCVLILQIVYFHHLSFRGQPEPTTLPLIKHWTDEKVRKRIASEAKASFGQGEIQKDVYLVCRKGGQQSYLGDVIKTAYRNFADRERRLVSFNLPDGVMTYNEIHEAAYDEVEKDLLFWARDSTHFSMLHVERINCIKDRIKKQKVNLSASDSQLFSETQKLIEDPRVQRAIDEIVKIYDDLRDVSNEFLSTWEEQHKNPETNPDYDGDNQDGADATLNFIHDDINLDDENEESEKEEEKEEDKNEEEKDENKEEKEEDEKEKEKDEKQ
ncbi:uncharacterized protein PFB0765w-like [Chenopodium quinoa]|uniref:uncharacterized protein PFB0765w-like n=1 Tax=Chenopodium quinoa TaxID=63459 RepID=UPI000B794B93|nr:uncharacterized protein PFB0765w-like [Chenopodium quinoa]XP_021719914.1 uncharacterized protein PFB0765w-like [Chenopodium quinoa]